MKQSQGALPARHASHINLVQRYALLLPFSGFAELAEFAVVPLPVHYQQPIQLKMPELL